MRNLSKRLMLLAALISAALSAPAHAAQPVTVFAAASLQEALQKAAGVFTAQTQIAVRFSFGSSGLLAKQIEQNAPADMFISADLDWMDFLQQRNLIDIPSRVELLGNELVLIAPKDSALTTVELSAAGLGAALSAGKLATGDVQSVPVGRYAKTALEKLGLWSLVLPSLAQTENVRSALAFVSRGEAALGIVYATDASADARVKVVATFPAGSHPPVIYPFALTKIATGDEAARFLGFLKSDEGLQILRGFGFSTPIVPHGSAR